MKGCLFAILAIGLCSSGLFALVKFRDWRLTPEQRQAEEAQALKSEQEARAAQMKIVEKKRAQNERVRDLSSGFIAEMLTYEGIESVTINAEGDLVKVRFAPSVHAGKDHVRVLCEGIAQKWADTAALPFVLCQSWYGNQVYAEGFCDRR